jgi:peptidoglycan/xylan/chitin deacetylase (PgdA/CDA1 family)
MLRAVLSSLLRNAVSNSGLLPLWENQITQWPRVLLYHYVDDRWPPFLSDMALSQSVFLEHIRKLRQRYRFLGWDEYKRSVTSPPEANCSILLTFDDGFRSSWLMAEELAAEQQIPSVFFVNTKALDNAYTPWMIQYYFLRSQADGKFLQPLWKSISKGVRLPAAAARKQFHEQFTIERVVAPIEEGLRVFGITPSELAQQCNLYVGQSEIAAANSRIEIGNHSHSHFVLAKLDETDLAEDLRSSDGILKSLLGRSPECFAYPFGVPAVHFNATCLAALRRISAYPFVFSAVDSSSIEASEMGDLGRICLDNVPTSEVTGRAAKVSPITLLHRLRCLNV